MNFIRETFSDSAGRGSSKRLMGIISGFTALALLVWHATGATDALDSAITAGAISFGYLGITGAEKFTARKDNGSTEQR